MPPLGDPGTNTTHERATRRGEPRAWCERKVNTLPGRVTRGWGAWVGTQKVTPCADALQEGGLTRWIIPKLGYDAVRPSTKSSDQVRRTHSKKHWNIKVYQFPWKFTKVRINLVYVSNALKHFKCFECFKRFKRVERFYTLQMRFKTL